MPYQRRADAVRFTVGQPVQISSTIMCPYIGNTGVIVNITSNPYSRTLDKYIVRFSNGAQSIFWDIQLKPVPGFADIATEKPPELPH